jgi:hypothetical protein
MVLRFYRRVPLYKMSQTTNKPKKCGACGEQGHAKTNKKCSMYKAKEVPRVFDSSIPHCEHVFQLVDTPEEVNLETLQLLIGQLTTPLHIRYFEQYGVSFKYNSRLLEIMLAEATHKGQHVGNGSGKMDVMGENLSSQKVAHDMCSLSFSGNSKISCEKSCMQDFTEGPNLHDRFRKGDDTGSVEVYCGLLNKHLDETRDSDGNKPAHMYLSCLLISGKDLYYVSFKIHCENISKISSAGFTEQKKSIHLKHVIHPEYGVAKLYASKTRLEVRFHKSILSHPFTKKLKI